MLCAFAESSATNRLVSRCKQERWELNDGIFLFVLKDNSYKDFIAIVGDEFVGSCCSALVSMLRFQASLCTFPFERTCESVCPDNLATTVNRIGRCTCTSTNTFVVIEEGRKQLHNIMNVGHFFSRFFIEEGNAAKV